MRRIFCSLITFFALFSGFSQSNDLELNLSQAEKLAGVPMECVSIEYPNKLNQVLADSSHLQSPAELHPIFYGCFDWHSSVHGHWLLARLLNKYPNTDLAQRITNLFDEQFQVRKAQMELAYFMPKVNKSFERTYGWAWLLKLQSELKKSELDASHKWSQTLAPLVKQVRNAYVAFLPKLVYPIRVGEHTNTAFGLSLALDYARSVGDGEFEELIVSRAKEFYMEDKGCPIGWEPSGFDFISPCLQEAELMSKILEEKAYKKWIVQFMPDLLDDSFDLEPGKVEDRTDGKLVHLDGLNFSRAWCLYGMQKKLPKQLSHLTDLADKHIRASNQHVVGSDYMGSHWLATFLVYALEARETISQ